MKLQVLGKMLSRAGISFSVAVSSCLADKSLAVACPITSRVSAVMERRQQSLGQWFSFLTAAIPWFISKEKIPLFSAMIGSETARQIALVNHWG